jgi:magnesium-transporting ATPase (P-type)
MAVELEPTLDGRGVDPEEAIDLLLRHLGTRSDGLSEREAARRLEQYGSNEIHRREGPGHFRALVQQFTHPLALLLWVAAALAFLTALTPLAIAIVAVIVLNAGFAFVQELQAERATEALREFLPATAKVRRDAAERDLDARELVPGDVILLSEGDRLSADARLVDGALELDMSPLTGRRRRSSPTTSCSRGRCARPARPWVSSTRPAWPPSSAASPRSPSA